MIKLGKVSIETKGDKQVPRESISQPLFPV